MISLKQLLHCDHNEHNT